MVMVWYGNLQLRVRQEVFVLLFPTFIVIFQRHFLYHHKAIIIILQDIFI